MSPELWQTRVRGMIEDIRRIESFLEGIERDAFIYDEKTVFAVSYAFVRLGEAAGHVPPGVIAQSPDIEWREIRHFRNFMIHVYLAVDPARLFDTARTDLPVLLPKLEALLARTEGIE